MSASHAPAIPFRPARAWELTAPAKLAVTLLVVLGLAAAGFAVAFSLPQSTPAQPAHFFGPTSTTR